MRITSNDFFNRSYKNKKGIFDTLLQDNKKFLVFKKNLKIVSLVHVYLISQDRLESWCHISMVQKVKLERKYVN